MKKYRIAANIDHRRWWDFILTHPQGNFFQSPGVFELFSGTENYEPLFFVVLDENETIKGALVAVIQRERPGMMGYFSSRTVVWGGPLVDSSTDGTGEDIMGMLLAELVRKVSSRSIYIQVRNFFDMGRYGKEFEKKGFTYTKHLNYIVETNLREETEKKIGNGKMRQVRKSLKNGARIIEPRDIEQVKAFYDIVKNLYKTRVKRPLPHWSFFKTFYELSQNNPIGKYFLVEYNGGVIGGIMCPMTTQRNIYEWYVAGLDTEYKKLGIYPSVLATWAPIDYALENRLWHFDFMGAGKPGRDSGVRDFKAGFGGVLVENGRFERINHKTLFLLGKLGLKILGALKK